MITDIETVVQKAQKRDIDRVKKLKKETEKVRRLKRKITEKEER